MPDNLGTLKLSIRKRLRDEGVAEPEWETRQLLSHFTGLTPEQLAGQSGLYFSDQTVAGLMKAVRLREGGMPLAYILGNWDFYGLNLLVTPDVLIPRADTETLCTAALEYLHGEGRVLDLCCGCGCLGLAVAYHRPRCNVVLADISEKALAVAGENRKRLGLKNIIYLTRLDALEPPRENLGRFDLILCNPPYIGEDEYLCLEPGVRCYEPKLALYGGEDGFDFYRSLTAHWEAALRPRGVLCLEVGWQQAAAVAALLKDAGYRDISVRKDTAGIDRVVCARRAAVL